MAGVKTITSSNSVYMLSVANLFDTPVQLQGFMADAMFTGSNRKVAETVMGADGNLSGGHVWTAYVQKISIMPDSDSYTLFEEWSSSADSQGEIFIAKATIQIPSIGRKYTMQKGILTSHKDIPDAKNVLNGSEFEITWERVIPANM